MLELKSAYIVLGTIFLFCSFLPMISHVLFAVAAYYDAKAKLNQNALMWGLLIGFLGLIPGIVYLCVRNNPAQEFVRCAKCGATYHGAYMNCPGCGEPNFMNVQYLNPFVEQQKHRAKVLCIIASVLLGLTVFGLIAMVAFFAAILN